MGSNNLLNEPGKKSARINDKDVERAKILGIEDVSASTGISRLLEKAVELQEIKDELRKKFDSEQEEIERKKRLYNL